MSNGATNIHTSVGGTANMLVAHVAALGTFAGTLEHIFPQIIAAAGSLMACAFYGVNIWIMIKNREVRAQDRVDEVVRHSKELVASKHLQHEVDEVPKRGE
jgi:hypothetical protein